MSQNVYDREDFFVEYSKLPRSKDGLEGALEWPLLQSLVGDVSGARILDLGCGYGWFCRWAEVAGAKSVHGIDVSTRMLEQAESMATPESITTYTIEDLESIRLSEGSHDLVYSSLAFHYVKELERLFREVHQTLRPGGSFVFSVEHPIFTAPMETPTFIKYPGTERFVWPLDSYADESSRTRNWLADGVMKQHRKIETYVALLVNAGFVIYALKEWTPSAAQLERYPEYSKEVNRPLFLLIAAHKS